MPTPNKSGCAPTASRNPTRMFRYSSRMFQCSPSGMRTGSLGKRCTASTLSCSGAKGPSITRPLVGPRSTAATHPLVTACPRSPEESGGNAGVDGNMQTGRVTEIGRAEHEHRIGDVLGEHLAIQQRPGGVVL